MSIYKFKEEEIFVNSLRMYPKCEFTVYSGTVYIDNQMPDSGSFTSASLSVPSGYVSLNELNIDRLSGSNNLIYPFITKDGSLQSFATVSSTAFSTNFAYGDKITGSYPMSSSLYRNYYVPLDESTFTGETPSHFGAPRADGGSYLQRPHVVALTNTLNYYQKNSKHYAFNSSLGDKGSQELNLISIPSIFYGSKIKKGTVNLKYFITGTLIGELSDEKRNGELIQVGPPRSTGSGSVAGVVLYTEGFVVLTGSWDLHDDTHNYINDATALKKSKWVHWGTGITGFSTPTITSSHCQISFKGDTTVPTMMMYAHAPKGQLNHSNNPTFIESGQTLYTSSVEQTGTLYVEAPDATIKNTVYSPYDNNTETFEKHTYITKVGIYDEYMNLLGVAKVAKPVKKTEDREFSFKLKIDI